MSPGSSNAGGCAVTLYVGKGPRGSNGAHSTLHQISVFHSAIHSQIGPLWCWFPSGWACARPRPLWVSPTTSPVKLGVSPAAAPTPMGVFTQRFEALFPRAGALGCVVCFSPCRFSGLSVHECGAAGSASGQTACPVCPTLCQSRSRHGESSPPRCPSPPLLPVWMNVYFYFLGVRLPCCSIFCHFWLCEEAQCVYLRCHLGSPFSHNPKRELLGQRKSVGILKDSGGCCQLVFKWSFTIYKTTQFMRIPVSVYCQSHFRLKEKRF